MSNAIDTKFPPRVHVEFWNEGEDDEIVIPATAAYMEANDCTHQYLSLKEHEHLLSSTKEKLAVALEGVSKLALLQLQTGSDDDYGHGLYNGLKVALATITNTDAIVLSKAEFIAAKREALALAKLQGMPEGEVR